MSVTCFTVEFPTPSKEDVLAHSCPYYMCRARAGDPCVASRYNHRGNRQVSRPISKPHHDRVAAAVGLDVVRSCSIYRRKK